jgi:hypothetical protein
MSQIPPNHPPKPNVGPDSDPKEKTPVPPYFPDDLDIDEV